ncbi:MAG: 50S ribosomal protein L29 [Alphaproteobacteria bacterium]
MQPKEIRDLGPDELAAKEAEIREEIFRLRLRGATGQVENKMRARMVRRDLARVMTIRREKAGR